MDSFEGIRSLAVKCEGCKYEPFKQAYSVIPMSTLDHNGDEGGEECSYEPVALFAYNQADKFEQMVGDFEDYVRRRKPKLGDLVHLVLLGYKQSECCEILGDSHSTVTSRVDKLKMMVKEYLETVGD